MHDPHRIIDAAANRAREALRVMEDAARFLLDDRDLVSELKALRHELARNLAPLSGLERWRDTPGDVGTGVSRRSEGERAGPWQVVVAAGKRLSESLRSIEEYAKTLGEEAGSLPGEAEAMRYRGYELERRLISAMGSGRARQWRLCVLVSEALCPEGAWRAVAEAAVAGGADCLQLREKRLDAGPLLERAEALVALARPAGVAVIVNDRPDVALAAGADGVHLGQTDLPPDRTRRVAGRRLLVGVSTSNLAEAEAAVRAGADYVGAGPMFETRTKSKDRIAGPAYLRQLTGAWPGLPHLAIGGVTPAGIQRLVAAGARGVAVSRAVCCAEDPAAVCRTIRASFNDEKSG